MSFFNTDISKQTITINGILYSRDSILNTVEGEQPFSNDLLSFLKEWFNDSPYILVQTSGSTGVPKQIEVEKVRMLQSAKLTCNFLGLKGGDSALLCMNLKYIGAKMVVVRSLFAGLDLVPIEASGYPLKEIEITVFAAMTPMQVYNSLQDNKQREKLRRIRHLIIGGGAVDATLSNDLANFPHAIWSTYGMTETLSHIALRRINGKSASEWYTPFEGVAISLSENQTLKIEAPLITQEVLVTNDVAEINEQGQFRILGRIDNIINSGGIKIQIEEVERLLSKSLSGEYMITSAQDTKFGEAVVLLVKNGIYTSSQIHSICKELLPPYWIPKAIFLLDTLPYTETNKPNRAEARLIAHKLYKS